MSELPTPLDRLIDMLGADRFIRCHVISHDWFHATMPTMREIGRMSEPTHDVVIEFVDRHVLLSQSSFAGLIESCGDLPFLYFNQVSEALLLLGQEAKSDGSCHEPTT